MKKAVAMLLVLVMVLSLAGCASKEQKALDKVTSYVEENGEKISDSLYIVVKKTDDYVASLSWNTEDKVFRMGYTGSGLQTFLVYNPESDEQTIKLDNGDAEEVATFSRSAFSPENRSVNVEVCVDPYGSDPEARLGGMVLITLDVCESLLEDAGVTLKDLGFTSWDSI